MTQPEPPPPTGARRRSSMVLVVVGAVVLAAGVVGGLSMLRPEREPPPAAAPAPTTPTEAAPVAVAQTAGAGDCLTITGDRIGAGTCEVGDYLVVQRFERTADGRRCAAARAPRSYVYDTAGDEDDFVLCLRQLTDADGD